MEPAQHLNQSTTIDGRGQLDASSIQLTLNTDPQLQQIENYLRGQVPVEVFVKDNETGETYKDWKYQVIGTAKCNEQGISGMMAYLYSVCNTHTILGNIKKEFHAEFISTFRKRLNKAMMLNRINWAIVQSEYSAIQDRLCFTAELLLTRPIDNLERNRLSQTMQHSEVTNVKGGGRSFLPFMGREKNMGMNNMQMQEA